MKLFLFVALFVCLHWPKLLSMFTHVVFVLLYLQHNFSTAFKSKQ